MEENINNIETTDYVSTADKLKNIVLVYYNEDGSESTIKLKSKFLTSEMRVKIQQLSVQQTMKMQEIEKSEDYLELKAKEELLKKEAEDELEKYIKENPNASEDTINSMKAVFEVQANSKRPPEELQKAMEFNIKGMATADMLGIKFFKTIINTYGLAPSEIEKLNSAEDSPFWRNVDMAVIAETNYLFRNTHRI